MTDSTRRSIRTAYQVLVAFVTGFPLVLALFPGEVSAVPVVIVFGAYVAIVARIINTLEDAGILPAWLKGDPQ